MSSQDTVANKLSVDVDVLQELTRAADPQEAAKMNSKKSHWSDGRQSPIQMKTSKNYPHRWSESKNCCKGLRTHFVDSISMQ